MSDLDLLQKVRQMRMFATVASLAALSACSNPFPQRVECEGACIDACGKWPPNNIQQKKNKHAQCATDYGAGYDVGYCAGVRGEHVFGVNSDGYVAGYYDGFADGEVMRGNDRELRACSV